MSGLGSFISLALYVAAAFATGGASLGLSAGWLMAAGAIVSLIDAREDMRRAKNQARDAYNASLEDRMEMVDITADQARTIVLGRVRCVEGVRRRWSLGENKEQLTMIVSFAGHEIDGFEQWYFDDTLITLDGSGYVTTAPWAKTTRDALQTTGALDVSGGATATLPANYISGTARAVWSDGVGESATQGDCSVSVSGLAATISGDFASAAYTLSYEVNNIIYTARIRPYLGTAAQNIGGALAAEYPGKITGNDRGAGIACAVVDLTYDPDIYTQGRPNITAVLRGAKVYDPRLDSTQPGGSGAHRANDKTTWAFSENPALHALHYALHEWGWAVPIEEINIADVMAAATACDVSTTFTLRKPDNSTTTVTLPRYRCGIVIKTDADRRTAMDEIMKTMAGRHGWAGGKWRMRAGTMGASVFALDASWIAQRLNEDGEPASSDEPVVRITNGVPRESRVTRVTGKCINPDERYQALPFPAVQDATLISNDGGIPMPLEVNFEGVNHNAHAQHLGTIFIRQGQAALRMQASCNMSAFRCELFDVGAVTLDRFGMAAKTFEVLGWRWHPNDGVTLTLGEIDASIFTPAAELKGLDPAPNSSLPPPWQVQAISGLTVVSGTDELSDASSLVARVKVSWTAATQNSVKAGGQIEVQFAEVVGSGVTLQWASWVESGSATSARIPGLRAQTRYAFRVRAIQGLPSVNGPWSALVQHLVTAKITSAIGGGNLVSNSGFEADSNADNLADGWELVSASTVTYTLSRPTGFYGIGKTQKAQIATTSNSANDAILRAAEAIFVLPGQKYVLSAMVDSNSSGTYLVADVYETTLTTRVGFFQSGFATAGTPRRLSVSFTAPATGVRVYPCVRGINDVGEFVTVDDVQLELGSIPTAYAPRADELLAGVVGTEHIAAGAATATSYISGGAGSWVSGPLGDAVVIGTAATGGSGAGASASYTNNTSGSVPVQADATMLGLSDSGTGGTPTGFFRYQINGGSYITSPMYAASAGAAPGTGIGAIQISIASGDSLSLQLMGATTALKTAAFDAWSLRLTAILR